MIRQHTLHEARIAARQAKARKARGLARWAKLGLTCAVAAAIWQEPALSPQTHDRMQASVAIAADWLAQTDGAGGYVTAMSGLSGHQPEGGANALTKALLDLRQ